MTFLLAVFGASLLGSLHCLGMCGALVALWAGRTGPCAGTLAQARPHASYHLGRLVAYGLVGCAAGGLGSLLDLASGSLLGVQRAAAIGCGALVLGWGGATVLQELGLFAGLPHRAPFAGLLARLAGRAHRALARLSPARQALLTGLCTPLLPCGWLWLFALAAAGSGGPLMGTGVMLAFWAGTVPPLLGLGLGLSALSPRVRPRLRLLGGLSLTVVGGLSLFGRGAGIEALPRAAVDGPEALATEPCCCGKTP